MAVMVTGSSVNNDMSYQFVSRYILKVGGFNFIIKKGYKLTVKVRAGRFRPAGLNREA